MCESLCWEEVHGVIVITVDSDYYLNIVENKNNPKQI